MKIADALKPDVLKLLIFIILISATSIPSNLLIQGADIGINHGFPMSFYGYGGGPPLMQGQEIPQYFRAESLLINIIFWYTIACFTALVIRRFKK